MVGTGLCWYPDLACRPPDAKATFEEMKPRCMMATNILLEYHESFEGSPMRRTLMLTALQQKLV